jgi:hypothetical protein
MGFLSRAAAGAWPRRAHRLACRFGTIARRPGGTLRERCYARELRPHAGADRVDALEPPPLAEHLHEVQAHPAAVDPVDRPGCDDSVAAAILDLQPERALSEADTDQQRLAGSGLAVAHAVGDQLGDQQLRAVEHRRRDHAAELPHGDAARGARRLRVRHQQDLQRRTHLDAAADARMPAPLNTQTVTIGSELGVFGLERLRPAMDVRDRRAQRVDHHRLTPARRAQRLQLSTTGRIQRERPPPVG